MPYQTVRGPDGMLYEIDDQTGHAKLSGKQDASAMIQSSTPAAKQGRKQVSDYITDWEKTPEGQRYVEAREMPFLDAAKLGVADAGVRLLTGLENVDRFLGDALIPESIQNLFPQTPIEAQIEADKAYAEHENLMQPMHEEAPVAMGFGEVPVSMVFGGLAGPATKRAGTTIIQGLAKAPGAAAGQGRSVLQRAVEAGQKAPGRVGKIFDRVHAESVAPRVAGQFAASRAPTRHYPGVTGNFGRMTGDALLGAAEGAIDPMSTMAGGALGSFLGSAGGHAARPLLHAAPRHWQGDDLEIVNWYADQGGYKNMMPGMWTGSQREQVFEDVLKNQERAMNMLRQWEQGDQTLTNNIAWEAAGIPFVKDRPITAELLTNHLDNLDKEYLSIAESLSPRVSREDLTSITDTLKKNRRKLTTTEMHARKMAEEYVNAFTKSAKPVVREGSIYKGNHHTVGFAPTGKSVAETLREIDEAIRNPTLKMNQSMTPQEVAAFEKAIEPFRNVLQKSLYDAAKQSGNPELIDDFTSLAEKRELSNLIIHKGMDLSSLNFNPQKFMRYLENHMPEQVLREQGGARVTLDKLAKYHKLKSRQAKAGLGGSDDINWRAADPDNPATLSIGQGMLVSPFMNYTMQHIPIADIFAMNMRQRLGKKGLFNWTGATPATDAVAYGRAGGMAGPVGETGADFLQGLFDYIGEDNEN